MTKWACQFCSDRFKKEKNLDYIQKRRGEPGLFSFEYNLLSKLLTDFYNYMDQAYIYNFPLVPILFGSKKTKSNEIVNQTFLRCKGIKIIM